MRSFPDGHLGCFRILASVNSAMDVGVRVSLFELVFFFLLDIYPGAEVLGHMMVLCLVFLRNTHFSPGLLQKLLSCCHCF